MGGSLPRHVLKGLPLALDDVWPASNAGQRWLRKGLSAHYAVALQVSFEVYFVRRQVLLSQLFVQRVRRVLVVGYLGADVQFLIVFGLLEELAGVGGALVLAVAVVEDSSSKLPQGRLRWAEPSGLERLLPGAKGVVQPRRIDGPLRLNLSACQRPYRRKELHLPTVCVRCAQVRAGCPRYNLGGGHLRSELVAPDLVYIEGLDLGGAW